MLYFGLVAGIVAGNLAAHSLSVDPFRVWISTLVLIVASLVGARLLFVAAHWQLFQNPDPQIWNRREGGLDLYGGFFLALALSAPLIRGLGLGLGAFWDVATFTMLVGLIFARIGCWLNGCCAGKPSSSRLAVNLPDSSGIWKKRIPTQLFETAWGGLLLTVAVLVRRSLPFPGALFLLCAAGYAGGRFLMEFAREQNPNDREFVLSRALSLVTLVASVCALTVHWPR